VDTGTAFGSHAKISPGAETASQHRANQRALLDEMRRKGEVPKRP